MPGVYGVPAQWPHVECLYTEAGFAGPDRIEIVHLADLDGCPRPGRRRCPGSRVRRRVGMTGVRLGAWLATDGGRIRRGRGAGHGAMRHPRLGGLADVGNLHIAEAYQRQGVAAWLLAHAAAWLRLAHVDRLLSYATPEEIALIGFLEKQGFVELTRTRRGWERSAG